MSQQINTTQQPTQLTTLRQVLIDEAKLSHSYWSQRMKEKNVQPGQLPTHYFFTRIKQRQRDNRIYRIY